MYEQTFSLLNIMSDEEADVLSRGRRRESAHSNRNKRLEVLNALRDARKSGKAFRQKVDDLISDVYVEVDENDYALARNKERAFVEDDDGNGYADSYSEDEFGEEEEIPKKKEKIPAKSKPEKRKKGTITSMFQSMKNKQDESSVKLEDDGLLNECLADLNCEMGSENIEDNETEVAESHMEYDITLRNPFKRAASPIHVPRPTKLCRNVDANINNKSVDIPNVDVDNDDEAENVYLPPKPRKIDAKSTTQSPLPPSLNTPVNAKSNVGVAPIKPPIVEDVKDTLVERFSANVEIQTNDDFNMDECPSSCGSENTIRFYYLDAFEDSIKHPGTVYLFGRIRTTDSSTFESCCVVAKNVMRQLFFLQRPLDAKTGEAISEDNFRQEVRDILQRDFSITKFKSKIVKKKILSRESALPVDGIALEVWVNANFGRIPMNLTGRTFSHVFNTTATSLERIVIERGLKGPCWLEISDAVPAECGVSHCKLEYDVDMERMKSINVLQNTSKMPVPPIRVMSLSVLTAFNQSQNEQQIVMISMLYNESILMDRPQFDRRFLKPFCIVTKLNKGQPLPFDFVTQLKSRNLDKLVKEAMDERVLLNMFLSKFSQINPDMIIAHDWQAQMSSLVARMKKYQLRDWHLISRLKRKIPLNRLGQSKFTQWELSAGRLCLDSKASSEELVRSKSYEMGDLVEQVLKPTDSTISRMNLSAEQLIEPFLTKSSKIDLLNIVEWNWTEALFCLRIIAQLNAIPLFLQITQIVGGVFSRTLMGGRAERNEFLLLHACYKNNYVAPDKYFSIKTIKNAKNGMSQNESQLDASTQAFDSTTPTDGLEDTEKPKVSDLAASTNKKAQYTGGLVLEPKKGLYDSFIVLLDFNSLYPSIIQEFNICFTTVSSAFAELNETELPEMPGDSKPDGILKMEIRELVNRRREVKNLMKKVDPNSIMYKQYNIRQMGLKLTANSMYGCLGFVQSRFYAKTLAAMVTSKGREILMHTRDLVQAEGYSVIYGDTDSIMVNTNSTDLELARNVGLKLKQIVNKNYRLLELDIDGIYKKLLLLKKKKYAGLAVDLNNENNISREMKGLDIVRRDWSVLAKEVGDEVVNLLLSSAERDEIVENIIELLSNLRKKLENNSIPLGKFEIFKQLTRNPFDYHDAKSQPHVLVALRLNESKRFSFKQGDVIKYIICEDGTNNSATQRAYHASEIVNDSENLSIDTKYYLSQQVHPVVSRLCEPIDEIDTVQIAEALGIDSSSFHRRLAHATVNEDEIEFGLEKDFSTCEGFSYECLKCGKLNVIRSMLRETGDEKNFQLSLENCVECSNPLAKEQLGAILKRLSLLLKSQVEKNIQSPFVCEDVTCNAECYIPAPHQWSNEGCICFKCQQGIMRKNYSCRQLFDQQCYYKTIFDLDDYLQSKHSKDKRHKLMSHPDFEIIAAAYKKCAAMVERFLLLNDFNKINLSIVLAPLYFQVGKKE